MNIDYHVEVDHHWYSVPYQLTQQEVEIRATATTVEVFHKGIRVASHGRSHTPHRHTTLDGHRPAAHQRYLEWTPSRVVEWSAKIGPATSEVVERILASNRHPEQGFRSCLGIIRLGDKYPHARVDAASRRALALGCCSYQSLKSILENGLEDQTPNRCPIPGRHSITPTSAAPTITTPFSRPTQGLIC